MIVKNDSNLLKKIDGTNDKFYQSIYLPFYLDNKKKKQVPNENFFECGENAFGEQENINDYYYSSVIKAYDENIKIFRFKEVDNLLIDIGTLSDNLVKGKEEERGVETKVIEFELLELKTQDKRGNQVFLLHICLEIRLKNNKNDFNIEEVTKLGQHIYKKYYEFDENGNRKDDKNNYITISYKKDEQKLLKLFNCKKEDVIDQLKMFFSTGNKLIKEEKEEALNKFGLNLIFHRRCFTYTAGVYKDKPDENEKVLFMDKKQIKADRFTALVMSKDEMYSTLLPNKNDLYKAIAEVFNLHELDEKNLESIDLIVEELSNHINPNPILKQLKKKKENKIKQIKACGLSETEQEKSIGEYLEDCSYTHFENNKMIIEKKYNALSSEEQQITLQKLKIKLKTINNKSLNKKIDNFENKLKSNMIDKVLNVFNLHELDEKNLESKDLILEGLCNNVKSSDSPTFQDLEIEKEDKIEQIKACGLSKKELGTKIKVYTEKCSCTKYKNNKNTLVKKYNVLSSEEQQSALMELKEKLFATNDKELNDEIKKFEKDEKQNKKNKKICLSTYRLIYLTIVIQKTLLWFINEQLNSSSGKYSLDNAKVEEFQRLSEAFSFYEMTPEQNGNDIYQRIQKKADIAEISKIVEHDMNVLIKRVGNENTDNVNKTVKHYTLITILIALLTLLATLDASKLEFLQPLIVVAIISVFAILIWCGVDVIKGKCIEINRKHLK